MKNVRLAKKEKQSKKVPVRYMKCVELTVKDDQTTQWIDRYFQVINDDSHLTVVYLLGKKNVEEENFIKY